MKNPKDMTALWLGVIRALATSMHVSEQTAARLIMAEVVKEAARIKAEQAPADVDVIDGT